MSTKVGIAIGLSLTLFGGIMSVVEPAVGAYSTTSQVAVLLFAALSFVPLVRALGLRYGLFVIAVLGCYAFFFETVALATHIPYGNFAYSEALGYRVFGLTPIAVFASWSPLLIGVYAIVQRARLASRVGRAAAVALGLVLVDLALDPGAVAHGLWAWAEPGAYYGVPFVNFVGWAVSGFGGGLIIDRLVAKELPLACVSTMVVMLVFWTGVNIGGLVIVPAGVGVGVLGWIWLVLKRSTLVKTL